MTHLERRTLARARETFPRTTQALEEIAADLIEIEAPEWFRAKLMRAIVTISSEVEGAAEHRRVAGLLAVASLLRSVFEQAPVKASGAIGPGR
jgi:hypothetical protein